MNNITLYIKEKKEHYGNPDGIIHNDKNYSYKSEYARAIIYNVGCHEAIFSEPGESHNSMLFDMDDNTRKKFNLYKNDNVPIRWVDTLLDNKKLKAENKCGRIWVIPNNISKHRKYDVYIAWWNEMTPKEFNSYNDSVIQSYNKEFSLNIESYIAVDNNGKFVLVEPDGNHVIIDPQDKKRAEDIKILKAIHLASQNEKEKYFKEFKKHRDEKNQQIYNHTKSKTEAEWRSLRYQENLNNNNNMKTLIEYILEKQRIGFGSANANYGECVILAGGAASGKGFIQNKIDIVGKHLDVDDLKRQYVKLAKAGVFKDDHEYDFTDPEDLNKLHIAVRNKGWKGKQRTLLKRAMDGEEVEQGIKADKSHSSKEMPNLIFDMVSKDIDDIEEVIGLAAGNGYRITLVWVVCNQETAKTSNIIRGIDSKENARSVSDAVLSGGHEGAYKTISDLFDNKYPEVNEFIDVAWIGFSCGWGRMLADKYRANPVIKVKKDSNNKFSWNKSEVDGFLKHQQPIDYSFLKSIDESTKTDEKTKWNKKKLAKFEELAPDFDEQKLEDAEAKNVARDNELEKFKARRAKKHGLKNPDDIHESWELEYDTI